MKTIGIITIQQSQNNYGGCLQCYALYEYLREQGYPCEVIDLSLPGRPDFIDSVHYRIMRTRYGVRSLAKGWIKELLGIRHLRNPNFKPSWNPVAGGRFDEFNAQIHYSKKYSFIPDLYSNPPVYDIYISGSDQLWNPEQPYCVEPYFLTFVKDKNALKISYGTSIGVSELRPNEMRKFRKWLMPYDRISVRENEACDLLSSFVPKEICRVPDPTFLLDPEKWKELAIVPKEDSPYILVFTLYQEKSIIDKAVSLAQQSKRKVIIIDQNYDGEDAPYMKIEREAGPREFIGLIGNADLVLTDSFHCTVFSLIMGARNFYTYIKPSSTRGGRIRDLLAQYELSDHIVSNMQEVNDYNYCVTINQDSVVLNLQRERELGRRYLKNALETEK